MATSYTELKTEIADFLERNDLTSVIDTFIDFCEAEMQRRIKLLSFESTTTVTMTTGAGTLPTDFVSARSVTWEGSPDRILRYVTPAELDRLNAADPSSVSFYTTIGSQILVADDQSGTLNMTYSAKFTALSGSNATNAILTNHPGAYLYGSLTHAAAYLKDPDSGIYYRKLFDLEIDQINRDAQDQRFAGPLAVRVA